MATLFRIVVLVFHALAVWAGAALFYSYFKHLEPTSFRLWHALIVIITVTAFFLLYYKFFGYFPVGWVIVATLVVVATADFIAFQVMGYDKLFFSIWDFVFSYALAAVNIYLVYHFFPK